MPQLMPLFWISSCFMIILIMIVLINLYWYKNVEVISISYFKFANLSLEYKW